MSAYFYCIIENRFDKPIGVGILIVVDVTDIELAKAEGIQLGTAIGTIVDTILFAPVLYVGNYVAMAFHNYLFGSCLTFNVISKKIGLGHDEMEGVDEFGNILVFGLSE